MKEQKGVVGTSSSPVLLGVFVNEISSVLTEDLSLRGYCNGPNSVSYTHLDVYKRQVVHSVLS